MLFSFLPRRIMFLGILICVILTSSSLGEKIAPEDCQPDTHYLCRDAQTCISKSYVCNNENDCPDKDDEAHCDMSKCGSESFWCHDGMKCVPLELKCDGVADCPDASDESDSICPSDGVGVSVERTARKDCDKEKEFDCGAKICIHNSMVCDGVPDCIDKRDENPETCKGRNVTCPGFLCSNGQCVHDPRSECDGLKDCADGSDELHCIPHCDISNGKFLCKNNDECINLDLVCDRKTDCPDGSDEGPECDHPEKCDVMRCDGPCKMLPTGPSCLCRPGTVYNNDTKICDYSNKCSTYGVCSQGCVSTNDTHYCTCANMFELDKKDNKSCNAFGDLPVLVYTTQKKVKTIYLQGSRTQVYSEVIARTKQAIGVSYDGQDYYWTELSEGKEAIFKYSPKTKSKEPLFTAGLETPEDLAVDWLTGNIYITDVGLKHIAVCEKTGTHCFMLVSTAELDKPRSIVLHPSESLMFWSDWGKSAHIGVAYMDGSDPKVLIDNLDWPNGLALDWPNGRIYWVDAKKHLIESSTITGKDRRVILSGIVRHPYGLAVFENRLYWSDWDTFSIESCDKFSGKDQEILVQGELIYDIHIYHRAMMPVQKHACLNHGCTHICLLSSNSSYKCACPENMELDSDKHTCKQAGKIYNFILGIGNFISAFPQQTFGRHESSLAYTTPATIDRMEFNSLTGEVFTADSHKKSIALHNLKTRKTNTLLDEHIMSVTSLAFDYLANNLYWVDYVKSTIEVYSLNKLSRTIVHHFPASERPVSIALIPSKGEMFVVMESDDRYHIDRLSMSGGHDHLHVIESNLSSKEPIFMTVDEREKLLYWSNGGARKIESSDFMGGDRKSFAETSRSPASLALINGEIYWSSARSSTLRWQKIGDKLIKQISLENPEGIKKLPDSISVTAGVPLKVSHHPCTIDNGGCSDVCLSSGEFTRTCLCKAGRVFSDKVQTTCVDRENCGFKCSTSGECVEKSQRCNGNPDCLDGTDEKECTLKTICKISEFTCKSGDQCIPEGQRCDMHFNCKDNSDEENCSESDRIHHCKENQLKCPSGTCLDVTQRCDRHDDCGDGFDEDPVQCQLIDCPSGFFKCSSGQCILKKFECNGFVDCALDNSDEHENCTTKICPDGFRPCSNGWCTKSSLFCDGHEDCADGFDEWNCPSTAPSGDKALNETCDESEFQCPSDLSICLKKSDVCNEESDCPKGEDEKNCTDCRKGEVSCKSGQCIYPHFLCDGTKDCDDGSDEENCHQQQEANPLLSCGSNQFKCAEGTCLPYTEVCDGTKNCRNGDDEGGLCETACNATKCDQGCHNTPKGGICYCNQGYELRGGANCEDINECLVKNPCSQKCENTDGSFRCSCHDEFILSSDKTTCKAQRGSDMMMLFVFFDQIRKFTPSLLTMDILFEAKNVRIAGIDVDMKREKLLFTVLNDNELIELDLQTGKKSSVFQGIPPATRIAHDWISGNTYLTHFSDDMKIEIHACNVARKKCSRIHKLLYREQIPTLKVDPINKFLFYIKVSSLYFISPTLELVRTRLDGSDPRIILNHTEITAFALDVDDQQIFFTDAETQSLKSMNYDGKDVKTLKTQSILLKNPISMSIYENHAYIFNQASSQVVKFKLYDDFKSDLIELHAKNPRSLIIGQDSTQKEGINNCEKHSCDGICIPADLGYKCLCGNGTMVARGVNCGDISQKNSSQEEASGSGFWWWSLFTVILIAAIAGAVFYMYQRRMKYGRFNVSFYFRNSQLCHALPRTNKPRTFSLSSSSPESPPGATAPTVNTINQKCQEFVYEDFNFCPTNSTQTNSAEVNGFSDEETRDIDDADFSNDPHQRLIL